MGIQSSINTALGVAAIASGLTNKKKVDRAQDKLDKSEEKLANTEKDLAKTTVEKNEVIEQQAKDAEADIAVDEQLKKMYSGGNTAKETNVDDAADKSVNDIKGPSINEFVKSSQQKVDPILKEQIMGFHALKMLDSRIAAKKAIVERSKRAMIRARKMGGNE